MSVTVDKSKLLETMQANRDGHRAIFLEAVDNYRAKVIELLDERLKHVRNGGKINLAFALPEPVDYTDSYDEAIERFKWHTEDTVKLDDDEFRQFVLDKWGWARAFAQNTTSYTAAANR